MFSDNNSNLAVVVIIFTVFSLAFGDALIKGSNATFSLWQIFVLRSLVVIPVLLLIARLYVKNVFLLPKYIGWTLVRSFCLSFMWVAYYWSLTYVNLSTAAAAYYTLPIFITLFAAAFLGDTIGLVKWVGVALGFIGVILILEPRASDFNWYTILPLFSAVLYAVAMILTRSKCREEHILVLSLWLNLVMLLVGFIVSLGLIIVPASSELVSSQKFLFGPWAGVGGFEVGVLGVLAAAIIIGSVGAAYAYQNGQPATIATFDFAYVGFAMLLGVVVFDESLTVRTVLGVLLIVIAGLCAVRGAGQPRN